MSKYYYKGKWYDINDLVDMSGISSPTIRARLRNGYSIEQALREDPLHDSVIEFCEASWWEDWIGLETSYLHEIYWNWCVSNELTPVGIKIFTKEIMMLYPNLIVMPSKKRNKYCRLIKFK